MKVLVTGAGGLLGAEVVRRLAPGHEVLAVHRPASAPPDLPARWLACDLARDAGGLPPVDAIVHLAASRRHWDFPAGADEVLQVSAGATVRLLARCAPRRFVLASSGAVYANAPRPLRESDPPAPPSYYGECKLAAERLAGRFGAATVALRLFFVYGPGQHPSMFLPALVERVRSGTPVTLAPPDGLRVNPVHVEDAAAAVVAALEGDAEGPVNVAGPEVVSLRELANAIGALVGRAPVFADAPSGEHLVGDITRMRACLLDPRIPVSQGLATLVG